MANEIIVNINNVRDLKGDIPSIFRIVCFLKISKNYLVINAEKETEKVIVVRIDDKYYKRSDVLVFVRTANGLIAARLHEKGITYTDDKVLDEILICIDEIRKPQEEFDDNSTTINPEKLKELQQKYYEEELRKEAESAAKYEKEKGRSLKTYGNLTIEEQLEIIARFQGVKLRILEEGVFRQLRDHNSNVDWKNNERFLRNAIHAEIEKLVAIRGNIKVNGGEFSPKDFQSFYYDIESQLLTTGAIKVLLEGVEQVSQDPDLVKFCEAKSANAYQTANFSEIVKLYVEKYGMTKEAALKAATYCDKALASGESATQAHIKGFISVGFTPRQAVELVRQKEGNAVNFEESMKLLGDHANFDKANIVIKDGKIVIGKLVINSAKIGGKNISIELIQIQINQALISQGKAPIGINELQRIIFNNFDGLEPDQAEYLSQTGNELRESYRETEYRNLFSENKVEFEQVPQYLEENDYSYQTEQPESSALGNGIKSFAGGLVKKGATKLAGNLALKAGLAATGIGAPVAGLLAAKDLAEKIPGVGNILEKGKDLLGATGVIGGLSPFSKLDFIRRNWKPIAVGAGAIGYMLANLLGGLVHTIWSLGGALAGGTVGATIGFAVGGPIGAVIGGGIGAAAGSYAGTQIGAAISGQGGLINIAGNAAAISQAAITSLPATLSGSIFASVPVIAMGTLMTVTIFRDFEIKNAFFLLPIDDMSISKDMPPSDKDSDYSCVDENGNTIEIPGGFAKGWPVRTGYVTSGSNMYTGRSSHKNAIDIGINVGTPIFATHNGSVVKVQRSDIGFGHLVVIEGSINGGKIETYYAHMSTITVSEGDEVQRGQNIGRSGDTGNSSGPHIHYEVRTFGNLTNYPIACTLPITKAEQDRINNGCSDNCNVPVN